MDVRLFVQKGKSCRCSSHAVWTCIGDSPGYILRIHPSYPPRRLTRRRYPRRHDSNCSRLCRSGEVRVLLFQFPNPLRREFIHGISANIQHPGCGVRHCLRFLSTQLVCDWSSSPWLSGRRAGKQDSSPPATTILIILQHLGA